MIRSAFMLGGAEVTTGEGYPGWKPNPSSPILKVAVDSYKKLFGVEPKVKAIHAGLECGLFLEKYPSLDMVSFGPTLRGVHSPDERMLIPTVDKFWRHLLDVLVHVPVAFATCLASITLLPRRGPFGIKISSFSSFSFPSSFSNLS